jgi:hypothetical protein
MALRISSVGPSRGIGSHIKLGNQGGQNTNRIMFISTWAVENTSDVEARLDYRVRLNWAKSWGDDTWFEYAPQDGVRTDIFSRSGGSPAMTIQGARTGGATIVTPVPPRATIDYQMGIILPGPLASDGMRTFWSKEKYYDFNLLVAPHEVTGGQFTRIGEHEFKGFVRLYMDGISGALRALPVTGGLQSPTLIVHVG